MKANKGLKTYSKLIKLKSFEERFEYLKLSSFISELTFGSKRFLNQALYSSDRWKKIRGEIIIRDNGCDLGMDGYDLIGRIYIHHLNPITIEDIRHGRSCVFDPENLICCSMDTHNRLHFGSEPPKSLVARRPNDTCPWKEVS